jgi:hypothetical protein
MSAAFDRYLRGLHFGRRLLAGLPAEEMAIIRAEARGDHSVPRFPVTDRERATVVAALRYWQQQLDACHGRDELDDIAEAAGPRLSSEEIDRLLVRLGG